MIIRAQVNVDAIRKVLNQNQNLTRNGFDHTDHQNRPVPNLPEERHEWRAHLLSAEGLAEITTACEYILSKDIPDWWTSYTLKHAAERWGRRHGYFGYVSNGAAIVAAILCGFTILELDNDPNCMFPEKDDGIFHRERGWGE